MLVVKLFHSIEYVFDKIQTFFYKRSLKNCGKKVYFRPATSDIKGLPNISIGNNVSIPKYSTIYTTEACLTIKDNVIFGPRPTIITGDHRVDVIGIPIIESHEKLPENDMDVIIEEDVWTGANVVILKGVVVGRGSVIAAGAVVNKPIPPYSIAGGVPARVLKNRFSLEQALEHERILYPVEDRLTHDQLKHLECRH